MYTCEFTGKRTRSGRSISKSLKGTKRRFRPNLHRKVVWCETLKRKVKFRATAPIVSAITKRGLDATLVQGNWRNLCPRLVRIKRLLSLNYVHDG